MVYLFENILFYFVYREENQFSVIGYKLTKIFVIASSDLSECDNLGLRFLRHFVPRNDISVYSF